MNTTPNQNKLETEIISAIAQIPKSIPQGRGDGLWTAAIKRSMIALGKSHGYSVCASGFPDECDREWLYDLVWYRNEPREHLREIGLVLESEWNRDPFEIKYDFEKLLVAKSPLKIMVFQDFRENLPQLLSLLETGIRAFPTQPANERYILAAFQEDQYGQDKDAFTFKSITT